MIWARKEGRRVSHIGRFEATTTTSRTTTPSAQRQKVPGDTAITARDERNRSRTDPRPPGTQLLHLVAPAPDELISKQRRAKPSRAARRMRADRQGPRDSKKPSDASTEPYRRRRNRIRLSNDPSRRLPRDVISVRSAGLPVVNDDTLRRYRGVQCWPDILLVNRTASWIKVLSVN